ncbi:MAG TPA: ABC-2 family transporter protein, partial [Myxococcota bacterium]|nr:ABC-2 family transporter protein [Myxococcota bacterium]
DGLRLYLRLASVGLRSQMQYRGAFLFRSIVDFGVMVSDLGPVWVLSRYFGHLDGWTFAELALLYGMVGSSWACVELGLRGFENFSVYLLRGDLDRLLLRPRSVVLQIAALDFEARKLARLAQALVVLSLASIALRLGPASLAWITAGILGGALCFAGIVLLGASLAFWTSGETAELQNALTFGGSAALSYPVSIYTQWFRRAITYGVPLAFVNYFPALAALGRTESAGWPRALPWLSPLACGAMLCVGLAAFARGLRRYESAGS